MRESVSGRPPAGFGTMIRIGWLGYCWAPANAGTSTAATSAATCMLRSRIHRETFLAATADTFTKIALKAGPVRYCNQFTLHPFGSKNLTTGKSKAAFIAAG